MFWLTGVRFFRVGGTGEGQLRKAESGKLTAEGLGWGECFLFWLTGVRVFRAEGPGEGELGVALAVDLGLVVWGAYMVFLPMNAREDGRGFEDYPVLILAN